MSYPDSEQNFFGRGEVLELLKKRVLGLKDGYRQNVAIIGNQYVGKSSILNQFIANLDDKDATVIYLDLENKDFSYFFHKFIGGLLYNFSRNENLPLHDDINLLLESTSKLIPHTTQVIRKIKDSFLAGKVNETFLGLVTLPEVFTNETSKFCVLIIDEFQNLGDLFAANVFQELGKKIMTQKRCFYIMSSSYPNTAKKILTEKLSLLFGNFEMVNVEPFDLLSCQQFIDYTLRDLKIGAQLRNFLTDFAGGHPLYINLICQELINLSAIYKQNEVYMPILAQAVESTIFDRWGVISRHFELIVNDLCIGKGNHTIPSVLMAISNGKHKIDEIMPSVNMKTPQLMQRINRLMDLGVIVKNGNFYSFKDKLFKYWIKYVYQKRLKDIELSPDKQRRQFKEEFNICLEGFKTTSRKDFSSRVIELLHCFDNESFDLNGRKYKMPFFKEIVPLKIKNENGIFFDGAKAFTQTSVWFVAMKKETFQETDFNVVLEEAKKIGKRPEKCLIVSLTNLDNNARLRALQEKFWIWNESELNSLLTLFDKPYILK